MSTAHAGLDPGAILAHLGVAGVADTALWRVRHAGGVSALRVMRAEQTEAAVREAAAIRAAAVGGIPAPRIEKQGAWPDTHGNARPVFLLEWVFGFTIMAAMLGRPWRAEAIGRRFGRMQARVHALPAPPELRTEPDRWLSLIEGDESALVAHLRALAPRTDALLHLDYHPLNVLLEGGRDFDPALPIPTGGSVVGVIDWTNARAGDPRADYANTAALIATMRGVTGLPPRAETAARHRLLRGWSRGYREVAGPLVDLAPFHAWAGASIYRDVVHRLGQPGSYVTPAYLDRLRRYTALWKQRAGVQ